MDLPSLTSSLFSEMSRGGANDRHSRSVSAYGFLGRIQAPHRSPQGTRLPAFPLEDHVFLFISQRGGTGIDTLNLSHCTALGLVRSAFFSDIG